MPISYVKNTTNNKNVDKRESPDAKQSILNVRILEIYLCLREKQVRQIRAFSFFFFLKLIKELNFAGK